MDSYCNYNNAFSNNESVDLDKLARKINNNKKKISFNDVTRISNYTNNTNIPQPLGYFPTHNNYSQNINDSSDDNIITNTNIYSDDMYDNKQDNKQDNEQDNEQDNKQDDKSIYSFNTLNSDSANIINDMSSNYSSLPSKVKNHMRLNTKHLKDFNSKDETNIINHLKKCDSCKNELLYILMSDQNNNLINNNSINNDKINNDKINNKSNAIINFNIDNNELKYIFILIIIGIFIIIIIDNILK